MQSSSSDSAAFVWRATLAGACASLVGIGLARFAYTPLIPPLIEAGWFSESDVIYLGAANLAGYLAGAWLGRPAASRLGAIGAIRAMMALAAASFFACAVPLSLAWFFVWRLLSGIAGGALMVLAAPAVLPHVPAARRGLASGGIFTGVGLGIAASGTLVPLLMRLGLVETWCALGALSTLLTAIAWRWWPRHDAKLDTAPQASPPQKPHLSPAMKAFYLAYGITGLGLVPHMVFLVDYVARGLDQGLDIGARYWVLFGLGAMMGPVVSGFIADRIGFGATLRLAFVTQAAAVALMAATAHPVAMVASSMIVGALMPGLVAVALGRVHELIPDSDQGRRAAWSVTTMSFALGQAAAAYLLSFLFARTGNYTLLFVLGMAGFLTSLGIDVFASRLKCLTPAR